MLSTLDTDRKWPLWNALSDLFLDTELAERDYQYIALKVLDTEIAPEDVVTILWFEVFPALCDNLRIVIGEWAGFDEVWLKQKVVNVIEGRERAYHLFGMLSVNQVIGIIEREWGKCCHYLPDNFAEVERPSNRDIKRHPSNTGTLKAFWSRLRGR